MLTEVWRVLSPHGGTLLVISGQEVSYVESFLGQLSWGSCTHQRVLSDKDRGAGLTVEQSTLGLWTCVKEAEQEGEDASW